MPIKSLIQDPMTGRQAEVVNDDEKNALVVATRPLKSYNNRILFFQNDEYGIEMAQNGEFSGTPEKVHDGNDTTLWTGSQLTPGTDIDFSNGNQNHTPSGSQSIYANRPELNEVWEIAKGSDLDLTGYSAMTMWIWVDSNWSGGDEVVVYGWDTVTSTQVGDAVELSAYFVPGLDDEWQRLAIPLEDMNLQDETIDAIRFEVTELSGTKVRFYTDDIQFEQAGNPIVYSITPDEGTWLHVDKFQIVYVDEYAGTLENGTMPNIPYNSFFGLGELDTGVVYQRTTNGIVSSSTNIRKHIDFMSFSDANIQGYGSDGTNSWVQITIKFPAAVILKAEEADRMKMTISEDLTDLISLKVSAGGFTELRQ